MEEIVHAGALKCASLVEAFGMYSAGMALFFVLVVAVANFLLGFVAAAKLGVGPKNWESVCAALTRQPIDDADAFSFLGHADEKRAAN